MQIPTHEGAHVPFFAVLEQVADAWMAALDGTGRDDLSLRHFAIVRVESDFQHEMFYGGLEIDSVVERIGTTSFTIATTVTQAGRQTAVVRAVLVQISAGRAAATPLSPAQRAALEALGTSG